jgi:hypothetical protein
VSTLRITAAVIALAAAFGIAGRLDLDTARDLGASSGPTRCYVTMGAALPDLERLGHTVAWTPLGDGSGTWWVNGVRVGASPYRLGEVEVCGTGPLADALASVGAPA